MIRPSVFRRRKRNILTVLLTSASVFALCTAASADVSPTTLPTGGVVAGGSVAISSQGAAMTVNQSSQRAIINWNTFDVGSGAQVNFNQPNASSVALNRVLSAAPSTINGKITANGQVYLINPAGMVFGAGSVVNAGGLVASTMDISDADFMAGQNIFKRNGSTGLIVNQGTLKADPGGMVALLAPNLRNEGVISAQMGTVVMAAGEQIVLNIDKAGGVTVQADPALIRTMIENRSIVVAEDGAVILSAKAADALIGSTINNSGTIEAASLTGNGGEVELSGATDITTTGTIDAGGVTGGKITIAADQTAGTADVGGAVKVAGSGGNGGTATVTGHHVLVDKGAKIDATGTTGGGAINVGGSWEAQDPNIPESAGAAIAPTAILDASAIGQGNGGSIVVRSDILDPNSVTRAYGTFLANGGPQGGDGGRIETSGHWLDTAGAQGSALAFIGRPGVWLFDPYNITISNGSTTAVTDVTGSGTETWTSNNTGSIVSASAISSDLNNGTSVTIATGAGGSGTTLGDITVSNAITKSSGAGDVTLTLSALNTIVLNADITQTGGSGKLNLDIDADSDHDGVGITILNSNLSTGGGYVKFGTGASATINGVNTLVGGDVYVSGSGAQTITTSGGLFQLNGQMILANPSGLTVDTSGGNVVFSGLVDSGDHYAFTATVESWNQAETDSENMGNHGAGDAVGASYLATITSRLENAVGAYTAGYRGGWLGAMRTSGIAPNTGFVWYWIVGPEGLQNGGKGLPFSNVSASVNGGYVNWNNGEPNGGGTGGGEWALEFVNTAGQWNDISPTDSYMLAGYLTETNLANSPLTVNSGAGHVTFGGAVGSNKALSTLTVNTSATDITFDGGAITDNSQSYPVNITLGGLTNNFKVNNGTFTTSSGQTITNISGADTSVSILASGDVELAANTAFINNGHEFNETLGSGGTLRVDANTDVNSNGGSILIQANAFTLDSTADLLGGSTGSLQIEPFTQGTTMGVGDTSTGTLKIGSSYFTSNLINNTFGTVIFGGPTTGLLTVGSTPTLIHDKTVYESGANMTLNADASLSPVGVLGLKLDSTTGTLTENANAVMNVSNLILSGTQNILQDNSGTFNLNGGHNTVATLAAANTSSVDLINQSSLTVGSVSGVDGITSAGDITLQAAGAASDITLNKPVTSTGGNIVMATGRNFVNNNSSNTGIVANGSGKQYFVYATNPANSTTGMTGASKHYNQTYTAGATPSYASSANWFFYTSAPVLTVNLDAASITYGAADPTLTATYSGFINGDTSGSSGISGTVGTIASYTASGAGKRPAGTYVTTASPGSLLSTLGYTFTAGPTSTLTVGQRNATVTGFTASDKFFDGTTTATITNVSGVSGLLSGDSFSGGGGTANFADSMVGKGKTVSESSLILTGADGGNYHVTTTGLMTTAEIKAAAIFVPPVPVATNDVTPPPTTELLQMQPAAPGQSSQAPQVENNLTTAPIAMPQNSGNYGSQGVMVTQIQSSTGGNGGVLAVVSDIADGFSFTVPPSLVFGVAADNGATFATLVSGGALPSWLTYDPANKTFTAANVPPGGLPIIVAVNDKDDGKKVEVTISP